MVDLYNFYANNYRKYFQAILNGLQLIGDDLLLILLKDADAEYVKNQKLFETLPISLLYKQLVVFDQLDQRYYQLHDSTMQLIERFVRNDP